MRPLIFLAIFLGFTIKMLAQDVETGQSMAVGIQFRPIFPMAFLKTGNQQVQNEEYSVLVSPKFGFSAGMTVRYTLNKRFALETGLNFVQRNYNLTIERNATDTSLAYLSKTNFTIIGYEHPVKLLVFVRLSEKLYMNAAAGLQFTFFPSDIFTTDEGANDFDRYFKHSALRSGIDGNFRTGGDSFVQAGATVNLGWEYRTKKSGAIYFGATYHVPFSPIYQSKFEYTDETNPIPVESRVQGIELNGSYLTFDVRYFFQSKPISKNRNKKKK